MSKNKKATGGAVATPVAPVTSPATFDQFVANPDYASGGKGGKGGKNNQHYDDPNDCALHPNRCAKHPNWFAYTPDAPGGTTPGGPQPQPMPTPGGTANGGNAFAPDPNAPFDPVLYASFMRHKFWMDNAKNRGDDTANYGAGPMRTMAF